VVALNGAPVNGTVPNPSSSAAAFVLAPPELPGHFDAERARLADEIAAADARAATARARAFELPPRAAIANLTLQLRTSVDDALAAEALATAERPEVPPPLPPITLIIDAEAFARVIGTVLGEQLSVRGVDRATSVVDSVVRPPKPTMKHARHLDVFLIGVATLIALVILAAWIG
jgi:non-ribosomal peptide synthetase component F